MMKLKKTLYNGARVMMISPYENARGNTKQKKRKKRKKI